MQKIIIFELIFFKSPKFPQISFNWLLKLEPSWLLLLKPFWEVLRGFFYFFLLNFFKMISRGTSILNIVISNIKPHSSVSYAPGSMMKGFCPIEMHLPVLTLKKNIGSIPRFFLEKFDKKHRISLNHGVLCHSDQLWGTTDSEYPSH